MTSLRIFTLLSFSVTILFPFSSALAAPSISGTSGTWSDGNTVTINGSSFGSGTNALPIVWDHGQYASFPGPWSGGAPTTGDASAMSYSTGMNGVAMPHSRTTRYLTGAHLNTNNEYNGVHVFKATTAPSGYPAYTVMSGYYRMDPSWSFGNGVPNDYNMKIWLLSAGPEPFGGCTIYTSEGTFSSSSATIGQHGYADEISPPSPWGCGASPSAFDWPDARGTGPFFYCWDSLCEANPASEWVKYEFIAKWTDQANGWFDIIINGGMPRNQEAYTHTYEGHSAILAGGVTANSITESFMGYARDRGPNNRRYMADVYLSHGLQRVILGNASTYAASTIREYQGLTAWGASSISLTVNAGKFTDGSTAYLYVCDSANSCNSSGTAITIAASGGGDTTAPAPPSGLALQ